VPILLKHNLFIMSLDAVKLLGITFTKNPKKEILEFLEKSLIKSTKKGGKSSQNPQKTLTIVTPNPEQIMYARSHPQFLELLNRADVALPDGNGVVWAQRILGQKGSDKSSYDRLSVIPGVDFMEDLISWCSKEAVPIALIGSYKGLAVKALDRLSETHAGVRGWAVDGPEIVVRGDRVEMPSTEGYFMPLAKKIIQTHVQIIFVGLGAPKQEYFMEKLSQLLADIHHPLPIALMSVGGSFDEIAGKVPRAPTWVSNIGMKWLWRLIMEPWRITRQLALIQFIKMVLLEKLT
jgi:N-acetylglucosaminyldiphosphoundecaprenol N-acetyl-beta-D-mannosaminyltransferase